MPHDVVIVGGSYSGLAAGLQLGRARRDVVVIDGGERRNRYAATSHGFLGQDGQPPAVIAARGRAELLAYPTVTWHDDRVTNARSVGPDFEVTLASGSTIRARRIILATGVVDHLPDVPGLRELWGRRVFHCPYCHGYELGEGPIGVLASSALSMHHAMMLPDWGPTTFYTNGAFEPDEEERAALSRRGTAIDETAVLSLEEHPEGVDLNLADGRRVRVAGLFAIPRTEVAGRLAQQLGCEFESGPLGDFIKADPTRETSVPGIFACGDAARAMGSVAMAVGDGAMAGVGAHQTLIFRNDVRSAA
ncbi:thioredoxin reductase [Luteibacter rhizovicinus]|uniref:Thioredoxin reductase n=1 Tax=Luteibacter rhizovicinus TaxID=242606 RepID=A0A4V2W3T3_9GAMM|nr:NAD(P)/FAD-dependent oxidoreductase [Luteibacter rhizovicinus]TCV93199.1 thioredoxin reductase [Luteibacter rhizovicinus]